MQSALCRCGISLGSNMGDRLGHLRRARELILETPGWQGDSCLSAPIFETDPVGCAPGTASFYNTALELPVPGETPPARLLSRLQAIEVQLGRPSRHPRNASRPIDLDLLYFGDVRVAGAELTVPHPRLRERRFVLVPLAEIRPDLVLPGETRTIDGLLEQLADSSRVARVVTIW